MKLSESTDPLDFSDPQSFDKRSGSLVERLLFNRRGLVLLLCFFVTVILSGQLRHLEINANFEKMIPYDHPYVQNYLSNRDELGGQGNSLRIAVENTRGFIYESTYLETLKQINDEVFLIPGIDRPFMRSLWTPSTRWMAVTEDGLDGGAVIPDDYSGDAQSLNVVKSNVERSGEIGKLVALDGRSSVIYVPLLNLDTETGLTIDYQALSQRLETLRDKYSQRGVELHIIGFAKVVGDLISGLQKIIIFFVLAVFIIGAVLLWYTRCARSTFLVLFCSLIAIVWQLGLLPLFGLGLDPYSILVPFLVFAIGISHGAQKMNGIMQDIGRGAHKLIAARLTFRRLFLTGLTALLCDAVGFAVLSIIKIEVIQDLALVASIGVGMLIFTNLVLLPILLSYVGVSPAAAAKSMQSGAVGLVKEDRHRVWLFLDRFTQRGWATATVCGALGLAVFGFYVSLHVKIGDLEPGAPELRANSRYNLDNAYITENYAASSDVMIVMVKTPENQCALYKTQAKVDDLVWRLRDLPGVESTRSLAQLSRAGLVGMNEGNPKWFDLSQNQAMLNSIATNASRDLFNQRCSLLSVFIYLSDHKANTLEGVTNLVTDFSRDNATTEVQFLLAAGSAGFEAATNQVVRDANREMLIWVYAAVALLCLITFRSWRATLCAILPLMLTSVLCEALMVWLGIGIKVATLPVIALGVGIGVDYALYVMSVLLKNHRAGLGLSESYYGALLFTGKVVMLTGITLSAAVFFWVFSPIKFQADMGVLLAFMFLLNMLGALILLPALAYFLLSAPQVKNEK
ncbi:MULTISPECIES: efflux RND transporter permease subunit [Pseudomonas]|uniref:MMPL family transporter n=3 Tax=Pseudomonas gessardii TaxID=78544 RepID=A0ABS9FE62_9PSED|nr:MULTISPECIES: MMPL family transporter [Pseudomonas]MCF5110038.1 MMPL family transporter [Pseudomonas gessardii]NNA67430.1 MMPL family transporter [Pseudomonas gessardii]PHN61449.1 RND transporter [Pseudomonas sp. ICMP 8385]